MDGYLVVHWLIDGYIIGLGWWLIVGWPGGLGFESGYP